MSVISYQRLAHTARRVVNLPLGPPRELDTLVKVARWRAAHQADQPAFTFLVDGEFQEERISYADLDARSRAVAGALRQRGAAGRRVLVVFNPGLDYNVAIFGCLYAGAVAVPVYPPDPFRAHRTLPRLRAIVEDAQADFILGAEEYLGLLRGPMGDVGRAELIAMENIAGGEPPDDAVEPTGPGDLAILQYTSGSTGSPKGVMLTHANLMHNLAALHRLDREGVVAVSWLPPYHDMGLIGCLLLPVHSGRHIVLMSPLAFMQRPARWLEAITRYRAMTSGAPNFGYELCVRKVTPDQRRGLDLSSWSVTVNGAEPVRPETIDAFVETFGPCGFRREAFYPAFGMAESTLLVSGGHRDDPPVERAFSADALSRADVVPVELHAPDAKRMIGCGQPIPRGEIVIVDPSSRRPLPPGRVGEIWVRSPSVGVGYYNRPEKTRRVFGARLAGGPRRRYLRTGDLGFIHDGELFVAGRLKELIILGGRNYYPQDIEHAAQRAHPALKGDAGAAFSIEADGQEQLVVVQEIVRPKKWNLDEVLRAVRIELAEQFELSPRAVVLIPAGTLPKTSSGKTRRRACRELYLSGEMRPLAVWRAESGGADGDGNGRPRAAPQGPFEVRLARLWRELLTAESIKRDDDFFALGGHSLGAVQLLARIGGEFGVELDIPSLFRDPTLAGMARTIEAAGGKREPLAAPATARRRTIPRRLAEEPAVLSFAEQRLWFFDQLQPGHPFYNMPVAARLTGPLEVPAFEKAIEGLVARHEALRTCYPSELGRPLRNVLPPGLAPLEYIDLESAGESRRGLDALLVELARRPFNLAEGPLFRCVLLRLGPQEHVVLLAMHHIIVDGWSVGVMIEELGALYEAARSGREAGLPPIEIDYADFAAWQHEHVLDEVLEPESAYWQEQLHPEPPPLDLPLDRPRPADSTFAGALRPFEFSHELSEALRRLARQERTTPFVVLLAAYAVMLGRWARQTDLTVGTVVANRTREELERVVGFFANTLALRVDLSGGPTFRELLRRAEQVVLGALAHQELPFDKLVEVLDPRRYRNRAPLFQVALVLENMPLGFDRRGPWRVEPITVDTGTAKYDLAFLLFERQGRLTGQVEYSTALWDAETIDRLIDSFRAVLEAAVRNPDSPMARLPLVGHAERRRIVGPLAGRGEDEPRAGSLPGLFEDWADAAPDRAALSCDGHEISYAALERAANRVAHRLLADGLRAEQPVAVCLPRSVELVVALLGVLKAGGVYVPLDPQLPADRLRTILDDLSTLGPGRAAPPRVVTLRRWLDRLPPGACRALLIDDDAPAALRSRQSGAEGDSLEARPRVAVAPEQLAYILYTSGSTGLPKGALNEHRGAVNFVRAFSRALGIGPDDRVLHFFSPSSDGSLSDIFSALANGACLVVAPAEIIRTSGALQRLAQEQSVSVATLTPSMLPLLEPESLPKLRVVCSVGEAASPEMVARWSRGCRLINGYGVTEAACGACLMDLSEWSPGEGARVPIGRPLHNVRLYVVDEQLEVVPIGVPGELCIGGVQVGRGYLNRPEETARRFVADPFDDTPGARLYRTGDLARLRADGCFEFLGRIDEQLNLRGHRVEPGEIVAALESHPLVEQAAVIAREDTPGSPRLVAYLVPTPVEPTEPLDPPAGTGATAPADPRAIVDSGAATAGEGGAAGTRRAQALGDSIAEVRAHLKARLPGYMIPSAFVVLDALPRTPQGKLDRAALPAPTPANEWRGGPAVAPRDAEEALVAAVWEELLGVAPVGVTDDFFELGGHSMLAVRVMAEIERRAGRRLPLSALFQQPTVEHLAALLRRGEECSAENSLVPLQPLGRGRPFFCIHPAGGTVFCYRDLAARLGADRPFYGLQAVGVDGMRPPHETVEAMVAHYIEAIRSVQPRGPYLIGGWSLGGNLAFETARTLREQGETIALLAVFDAGALRPDREPAPEDFLPMVMELFPDEDNLPLETIQGMSPREQLEYFAARAQHARVVLGNTDLEATRAVFEVFKTSMKAMIDYRQKPYDGKLTLFAAENRGKLFGSGDDPLLGWGAYARGGVEVHRIPGRHVHMVLEPHVETLAARLRECLHRADPPG